MKPSEIFHRITLCILSFLSFHHAANDEIRNVLLCRHVRGAHVYINLSNYYAVSGILAAIFLSMIPYLVPGRHFPFTYWTPFDATGTKATFLLMYAFEVICGWVAALFNIFTDILIFVVLIDVNFVRALLCERIQTIGDTRSDGKQCKNGNASANLRVREELIEFINVHYKSIR